MEHSMPIFDEEVARKLEEAARSQRPYAGFFDWPDAETAEWGVAKALSEAAVSEPGFPLTGLVSRGQGNDPPDCEALDASGRRVAVEVTELVDGAAIASARKHGGNNWASWDSTKFLQALESRIRSKDAKTLKGGPYSEYIVVIHTDEPMLSIELVEQWLGEIALPSAGQIQRAYLLLSYDPHRKGYPYVRLKW
jgi:hypothetical protein